MLPGHSLDQIEHLWEELKRRPKENVASFPDFMPHRDQAGIEVGLPYEVLPSLSSYLVTGLNTVPYIATKVRLSTMFCCAAVTSFPINVY